MVRFPSLPRTVARADGVCRFEGVTMGNRGCGGGITAWKGGETVGESPLRPP